MQCHAASRCLPAGPASRAASRRSPPRPASTRLQPVHASSRPVDPLEVKVVRHLKAVAAWGGTSMQGRFSIERLQQLLGRQDAAQASQLAGLPSLYSPPEGSEPLGPEAVAGMAALDALLTKWYPRACPALTHAADTAAAAAAASCGLIGLPTSVAMLDSMIEGDQSLPNLSWRHEDFCGDFNLRPAIIYNVMRRCVLGWYGFAGLQVWWQQVLRLVAYVCFDRVPSPCRHCVSYPSRSNGYGLFAGVGVADFGMFAYPKDIRAARFEVDGRAHRLVAELWASPLVVAAVPVVRTVYKGSERVAAASRYHAVFPALFENISFAPLPPAAPSSP